MIPLWLWTAFAGLAVGMIYAWLSRNRNAKETEPSKVLTLDEVDQITTLIAKRQRARAVRFLRLSTGLSVLDAKNRIDDWRPEEEREAAR